jgi:hypothetical protein
LCYSVVAPPGPSWSHGGFRREPRLPETVESRAQLQHKLWMLSDGRGGPALNAQAFSPWSPGS